MRTFTQKLAFSLVVLLCILVSPISAAELTVADGPEKSEYLPIYGYYVDQEGTHGQCLYPASMLSSMNDGIISKMIFYVEGTTVYDFGGAVFNVSLGETENDELSGTFFSEGLAQVYSGHLSANGTMIVEFDNSYDYSGKNLIVDFYVEKKGSWKRPNFLGITSVTSAGHYKGGYQEGLEDFLPKVTFEYTPAVQGCDKPTTLEASNITAHSAALAWTQGSGTYNVQYKAATETEWTTALANTMQNSAQLTNLTPNTMYQARVQSVCFDTTSIWKTIGFKTAVGVPYAESFNNDFAPEGWNIYKGEWDSIRDGKPFGSWTTTNQYWKFGAQNGVFDSHAYVENSTRANAWLISPAISMEPDMQLSFDLALTKYQASSEPVAPASQPEARFMVLASVNNGTTWQILREWNNTGSVDVYDNISHSALGEEFAVDLSGYANKEVQIAFYAETQSPENAVNNIHIDNIRIDTIPSCLKPTKLAASDIAKHSALLSWQANTGESAWRVQYKKSSESVWQAIDVNTNPYELTGLEKYTDYDVRVAAICDASSPRGTSLYSKPCSFKTAIGLTFSEAFNTSIPGDWTKYTGLMQPIINQEEVLSYLPASSSYGWKVSSSYGAFGTSNHLNLNIGGTTCDYWLVSPTIELDKDQVQLSFDLSLTKAAGVLQHVVPGEQDDDKFAVLITTDDGETWETLRVWDNDESAYVYDNIKCTQEGQKVVINLSDYASDPATKKVRIAFYGESTEGQSTGAGSNYIHIANVLVDSISACPNPTNLEASGISASSATLFWDEAENATWAYGYVANPANDFVPQDADFADTVDVASAVISALQENTPYIFFVRRACGDGHSEYVSCRFRTGQVPVAITSTYSDDFESGDNWYPINGILTNAWVYGTAAHTGQDGHAIYISNDEGATNAYTVNKLGVVYAQKLFNFSTSGLYAFKYDWKAKGQITTYNHSANDYLRVALVPSSVELEASTNVLSGFSYNALPDGWIALDGGTYLANVTDWQNMEVDVQVPAGEYNVVFAWRNDGSSGSQTPAAIDNFSSARSTCVKPTGLVVSNVTASSAAVRWISGGEGQNAWQIALDTVAGFNPDTLSSLIDVTTNSYALENLEEKTTYYAYVRANCGSEDGYSDWVAFNSFTTFANCQLPDALATSDVTDSSAVISWNKYWADDFNLRYSADGANWTTVENVNTPYILTGLADNTDYQIQVQATCHTAAEWSESVNIHTKQRPFVLSGNYSDDFEDGNKWYFINGTCANAWSYGEAANNGGSHSIYISNDGGATNNYGSGATMVYATKSFIFEGGSYTFSYDWKANGQASNDYLRVALVPGTATINANTTTPPNFSATGLPSGWVALDGGSKLNLASSWQNYETAEIAVTAGEYRVVFAWRNDNYTFNQTPAAVDNFRISKVACSKPSGLDVTLTPGNGSIATLNWIAGGSETEWVVEYSTSADFSNAISQDVSTDPIANLSGLTPETEYYAHVNAVCGGENGDSDWSSAISFIPTDAYTLTINDGTATNAFVPFYAYYADNLTHTQFIIQETDLSAIKGDTIKQLTFYCNEGSHDFGDARFDIYMAAEDEIIVPSISGLSDWDALTNVKANCGLSISDNQLTIALDDPFEYPGGTLMIGFNQTIVGTCTGSTFKWYGVAATGASFGGYNTSLDQRNFVPKMTISYAPHQKISTGINSAEASDKPVKFIRNRQVYILVNGVIYDIMGRKVEVK